ncbi:MAG TPA: exodeoxyribonuclease VII small subunit [Candidatus Avipropionibacterium avicola]|uniref:Exodeoxyribonuclease 7 small subunit n=1 Tax=Candidatus Avipropionibacterium avicola TaxID=2840701 RepID=A0A9D1GUT8_9ACTN|nr:exodeoxyribonuclease VII small subunit [Candidatus Avipropionibacterium avicola]
MTEPTPSAESTDGDAALSYEQARQQLADVVAKLEAGAPLEESLALWERGEELATLCRSRLDGAQERIEARVAERAESD